MTQLTTTRTALPCNASPSVLCWRLVHDGTKVIALFQSAGDTWTKQDLFCATTQADCLAEIARLGLAYTPDGAP